MNTSVRNEDKNNNLYMVQSQSSIHDPALATRPNRDIMHISAATAPVHNQLVLEVIKEEKKKKTDKKEHKSTCRICLSEESEIKDDPIVSPCWCKGSSGDIHIKCL